MLDLCESFNAESLEQYGLEFFPVIEAQLYCIVSKKHPYAKKDRINHSDLENQTIMMSTAQKDSYGNPQVSPSAGLGIIYKQFHSETSKKLEVATGRAIYFDYLFELPDLSVFSAIPYESKTKHTFGFAHRKNPSAGVLNFLEVAQKCGGELKQLQQEHINKLHTATAF